LQNKIVIKLLAKRLKICLEKKEETQYEERKKVFKLFIRKMKQASRVHSEGFVSFCRNKHQQFNSKIYSCGNGDDQSIAIWDFKDEEFSDDKVVIKMKEQCTSALACYVSYLR
jgi:hypothetical protein